MQNRLSFSTPLFPTLWRYFLKQYTEVFAISLFGFIVILFSTRLEDFAHFVTLGAPLSSATLFVFYQIFYVLQMALPISSLIASLFLFTKLSQNHALTAIRSSGMSLFQVISPLILFSILLSLITFNFFIEMGGRYHLAAKNLEHVMKSQNPLTILHSSKLRQSGGIHCDMKGSLSRDGVADDCIIVMQNGQQDHIALLIAEKMHVKDEHLQGQNVTLISTTEGKEENFFDNIFIENAKENRIELKDLSKVMSKKRVRPGNDEIPFPMLLAKKKGFTKMYREREFLGAKVKFAKRSLIRCYTEIARRVSLSLSIVTFTLMGIAFGSTIGRRMSRKKLLMVVLLTGFFLLCFLAAKGIDDKLLTSFAFYFAPHIVIITLSILRLHRLQKGVEV